MFGEIIKKLYSLWKWAKPSRTHSVPPPPLGQSASFGGGFSAWWGKIRQEKAPWQVTTLRGEGGVICGLISFDKGLLVFRPIQHEGGQRCAAPFLFRQDLPNGARLYKGPRTATRPQSTTLQSTGDISVWTKEVGHSNTRGTVRLCSFPLKFTAAQVYIFNILCRLKVIDSRHLQ